MWWKCSMYEDSVRIPMIAAGPGFAAGIRIATPVTLLDLQASIFHATGSTRPEGWKGMPLQRIPIHEPDRAIFSEYHGHGTRSGAFMIRKGDWKLIHNMDAPHQLFNLQDDPDELRNCHLTEPAKAADLEAELRRICDPERENRRAHEFEARQLAELGRPA
jgi:choline-sulfatase